MDLTAEQEIARDLFVSGQNVVVQAGAGTGKTTTLENLARSTGRVGRYLAFNRAIVNDAGRRMPGSCRASTIHSVAMGAVGNRFRHRLESPRQSSDTIARKVGIDPITVVYGDVAKVLQPGMLAGYAMRAVARFCQSADLEPGPQHVDYIDGIDPPTADGRRTYDNNRAVSHHLGPAIAAIWKDAQDPTGSLRYSHDRYLKLWELNDPQIGVDYILFDEAQDVSPVMLSIVMQQTSAQRVFVGDAQQAIYGWLGAVDAMNRLPEAFETFLTKSFRFGPAIADVANGVLDVLDADLRLTGHDPINSVVADLETPDAVLCRSNAHAVETVMLARGDGTRVHLVGNASEVTRFAQAALDLQSGRETSHPELACFYTWGEVQDYVAQDAQGGELRLMVDLIDKFGAAQIIAALNDMPPEDTAELVVSTAHKAKGREWSKVRLGSDFPEAGDDGWQPEELRLLYVAVTRARHTLDVSQVPYFKTPPNRRTVARG